MHSVVVVEFPSAGQGDDQGEELQEGDQGVHLQGEEEEAASRGACPLQGEEDSLKTFGGGGGGGGYPLSLLRLI